MELIGPYLVACSLLVVAGVAKVARPDGTARALAALPANRLPGRWVRDLVRGGAAVELGLGSAALAFPSPPLAAAVAFSYAVFAGVVAYVRRRGGALASCGCFGTPDTPATALHLAVDVVLCGAAAVVALAHPSGSVLGILARQPAHGVPLVVGSAVAAYLAYLAVSVLSELHAARALASGPFRSEPSTPPSGPLR